VPAAVSASCTRCADAGNGFAVIAQTVSPPATSITAPLM
jgi:hypothetical protein